MPDKTEPRAAPAHRPSPPSHADRRQARLDEALRANLKRRKQQVRNRDLEGDGERGDTPSIVKASRDRDGTT